MVFISLEISLEVISVYQLLKAIFLFHVDQVGKNLHVLGQIEGVDLDLYRDTVLPRILEQVSAVYV